MKRVLITGANSFLGDNTKKYLEQHGDYIVDVVDMLSEKWREKDFSKYDVVFNVCAIVHQPHIKDANLYYMVNRDLAVDIANKSKASGVKLFIQTSTNGVFGVDVGIMSTENGFHPKSLYEKSKYEADCLLSNLSDNNFKVCIIRPSLIYGKGCKGNFPKLENFAVSHHFFPSINNKRDFIYVDNLSDFIKYIIDNMIGGIYYPRDEQPVSSAKLIKAISELNGNKMHLCPLFNPFVKVLYKFFRSLRLVFGNCYCVEPQIAGWKQPYSLEQALKKMYDKQ